VSLQQATLVNYFAQMLLFYINLYSPKKTAATQKTQQRKHKYKQSETNDHILVIFNRYCSQWRI